MSEEQLHYIESPCHSSTGSGVKLYIRGWEPLKGSQALVNLLKYLRGNNSQSEWARRLNIDRSLISKAEKGQLPSEYVLNRWMELGIENVMREREQALIFQNMMAVAAQHQEELVMQ